jgi:hypothetical protein
MMNLEYRRRSRQTRPLLSSRTSHPGFGCVRPLFYPCRIQRRGQARWLSTSPLTTAECEPLWQTVLGCLIFAALYALVLVAR